MLYNKTQSFFKHFFCIKITALYMCKQIFEIKKKSTKIELYNQSVIDAQWYIVSDDDLHNDKLENKMR